MQKISLSGGLLSPSARLLPKCNTVYRCHTACTKCLDGQGSSMTETLFGEHTLNTLPLLLKTRIGSHLYLLLFLAFESLTL